MADMQIPIEAVKRIVFDYRQHVLGWLIPKMAELENSKDVVEKARWKELLAMLDFIERDSWAKPYVITSITKFETKPMDELGADGGVPRPTPLTGKERQ